MATEIERKFLVRDDGWRSAAGRGVPYVQGYLGGNAHCSVRVRIAASQATLNIKQAVVGARRAEYEYPVPLDDAREMLATLCGEALIEKTRHRLVWEGLEWEIDEFRGRNAGLVLAEIELARVDQPFARPPWLGAEVTDDPRYYNNALALDPWPRWGRTPGP